MGKSKKQFSLTVLCQKYYRQILLILSIFIVLFGVLVMWIKPINLTSGQTTSWWEIIKNIQSGKGYKSCNLEYVPNCQLTNQETAQREPLPIYLFTWIGFLSGNSVVAFQLVQILAHLLILFGVFFLAREIYTVEAAVVAALAWTVYLPAINLENSLTGDLLACLFVSYGFVQFIRIIKGNKLKNWLSFGVLFGLAALSRFATLAIVFGLGCGYLVYLYVNHRQKQRLPKRFFTKALLSMLVFSAIFSPWVIRNWLVFKQPVVSSSLVGYNLYRHNAIVAKDVPPHYVGPSEALAQVQALIVQRPEIMTPLNEAQLNEIFKEEAVKLIFSHPFKYAGLVVYRFIPLWFNIGIVEEYGASMNLWDYAIVFQQILLLTLFVFSLQEKNWVRYPIVLGILIYLAAFLVVEAQLRYAILVTTGMIAVSSQELVLVLHYFYDRSKIVRMLFEKLQHQLDVE